MPNYRAAVIDNGREIDFRVGATFTEVALWAEELRQAIGADEVRVREIKGDEQ